MWPDKSMPLSKLGLWEDSCTKEFRHLNRDIFTTPKYLGMYLKDAGISTVQQLFEVTFEKPFAFQKDDWKLVLIGNHFTNEFDDLATSDQNKGKLDTSYFNQIYIIFFILSSIIVLWVYPFAAHKNVYGIYGLILVYFVINAYVTSNFSMVAPRFQNRIFWIISATNALLIFKFVQNKYFNKQ